MFNRWLCLSAHWLFSGFLHLKLQCVYFLLQYSIFMKLVRTTAALVLGSKAFLETIYELCQEVLGTALKIINSMTWIKVKTTFFTSSQFSVQLWFYLCVQVSSCPVVLVSLMAARYSTVCQNRYSWACTSFSGSIRKNDLKPADDGVIWTYTNVLNIISTMDR